MAWRLLNAVLMTLSTFGLGICSTFGLKIRTAWGVGPVLALGLLTRALPAAAQGAEPTEAAPSAALPQAADSPPPIPPAPAPSGCALGAHAGVPVEDAATTASLVCREVERFGGPKNHRYRVDIDRLGDAAFLSLTDETSLDSRRVRLASIEEAADAAPRIAEALVKKKDLKQTERTDNLLESETRAPLQKSGSVLFGVGVLGAYAPGVNVLAPGIELSLRYDTPHWVAHSSLRYLNHSSGSERLQLFDWGVGARYLFGTADLAPFAGGGFAYMALERNEAPTGTGLGAFAEVGVEALRMHRNHFGLTLRADAPLFTVDDKYTVPLSLGVHVTF